MCGRFILFAPPAVVADLFQVAETPDLTPRYNIAPTQPVAVVRLAGERGVRECVSLRWGLIPSWAKEARGGPPLINARAETAADKPAFRAAVRKRRCLIPADGFYEWLTLKGRKQPFCFRPWDGRPFAFAGLWERWHGPDGTVESCTILTTGANDLVSPVHDRMPVILAARQHEQWLDPAIQDPELLTRFLRPNRSEEMRVHPVGPWVGNARQDDARCMAALA